MNHLTIRLFSCWPAMCLLLLSCTAQHRPMESYGRSVYTAQWAGGFDIRAEEGRESRLIITRLPWQTTDTSQQTYLWLKRGGESVPAGFSGQVLEGEAHRLVCMSSSYVAMLDALGLVDRVVGVSGLDYVSNPYVQQHRDRIGDVGYEGNVDYETLVALQPDLVLLYGVNGSSALEPQLRQLGIPFMYVGEYREESPLGKAEWMVALAEVTGNRQRGENVFSGIPLRYQALKEAAQSLVSRPGVMINTPYGDSWVMAARDSYVARLIEDAGGDYLYRTEETGRSVPIDMEEAYRLASRADVWINVGQWADMAGFTAMFPKFADTRPVREGQVWNTTLHLTPNGGNEYWETAVIYPDRVLNDLIRIFHPGELPLAEQAGWFYYTRLE